MKTTTEGRKNETQWTLLDQLDDPDFADDLALLSHSCNQIQDKTTLLATTSAGVRLNVNTRKTEFMKINITSNAPITVDNHQIREVESFVYRGSVLDRQRDTELK